MSRLLDLNVNEKLVKLLEAQEMKVEKQEDYYFVDGFFPGIVAQAFEMEDFGESVVVQLDITLIFPEQHFVESFVAQAGTPEEAIEVAFEQFEVNVLHTLIKAFWENAKQVENGVGTDVWEINGHRWQAVVSNYGYRGDVDLDEVIDDLDTLYVAIEEQIKAFDATENIYAFRTVYTNTSEGEAVVEAYVNNQEFPELENSVANLGWKPSNSFYSVRNLVLLMKLQDETQEA